MYDDYRGGGGGGVFVAFLLGGVLGAVIALLYSPRSGKENREFLKAKSDEYMAEGKDLYATGRAKIEEAWDQGRDYAGERAGDLRGKIDTVRERLKEQADKFPGAAKKAVGDISEDAVDVVDKAAEAAKSGIGVAAEKVSEVLEGLEAPSDAPPAAV